MQSVQRSSFVTKYLSSHNVNSSSVKVDASARCVRHSCIKLSDSPQSVRVFSPTYKKAVTTVKPSIERPPNPKQVLKSRKLRNVNLHKLGQDMNSSTLLKSPSSDFTELCDQYDAVLSSILDEHAPLRTRIITLRPHAPWYNNDIRKQKTICRKRERCWCRSGLASDYQSSVD